MSHCLTWRLLPMFILDAAITPLERVRINGALAAKTKQLNSDLKPLERVRVSRDAVELMERLGMNAPAADVEDDGLSDDPSAPNYRYRDTGYIAASRKELAQDQIRAARDSGARLLATDLDWSAIEQNPRLATELIVKSNLFGQVDWEALKTDGMDPAAGFLIDRIYASIAPQPSADTPRARKDYATALQTIRDRLETCRTPGEVTDVLEEIKDELSGVQLNAEESDDYRALQDQIGALSAKLRALKADRAVLENALSTVRGDLWEYQRQQDSRIRRKWKPDPELQANIDKLTPAVEAATNALIDWDKANPEYKDVYETKADENGRSIRLSGGINGQIQDLYRQQRAITEAAKTRNILESELTRGWLTFGERFFGLLHWRSYRGSDAFASHVTRAKNGKITDWSWSEKERTVVKRAKRQEINFQLKVAERYERIGGRQVSVDSTFALKDLLNFRDVQTGNWVQKDPNSAKFHTEQTAAAMLDLSDILGIDAKAVGLGGRLAMAFGARGQGNAGFGGAARAHYESVHRVINLTKMGGGGALGHEYFHAIDDMLAELMTGQAGPSRNYASANPSALPPGVVQDAMIRLSGVFRSGDKRLTETFKVTEKDRARARHNVDGYSPNGLARTIKNAGNAEAAIKGIRDYFMDRNDKRSIANCKAWVTLAAAYYAPDGEDYVQVKTGRPVSSFYYEAVRLDGGSEGKYWSEPHELAARAFQSYLEDKLAKDGRKNDYLSIYADNKYHYDALLGIQWNPYPEGEERTRINEAFDAFFDAIRSEQVFEKASANPALLDSIFGAMEPNQELANVLRNLRESSPGADRTRMAQRVMELIPICFFDSPEEEDEIVARVSEILEDME